MKSLLTALLLTVFTASSAQRTHSDSLAYEVHVAQVLRMTSVKSTDYKQKAAHFDSALHALLLTDSFHIKTIPRFNSFASSEQLSGYRSVSLMGRQYYTIIYSTSKDGKIRLYTWQNLTDTCDHSYRNHLVFLKSELPVQHSTIDSIDQQPHSKQWSNMGYYRIEQHDIDGMRYYFLYGFKSSCELLAHRQLRIFTLDQGRFTECFMCYENNVPFETTGYRLDNPDITIGKNGKTIELKQYYMDVNRQDFQKSPFQIITYKWENGRYIKAQKKR
jgi:hypothetical protein